MSNYQLFHNDLPTQVLKSFKGDISIDTETLGLNIKRDRLCLVQMRNESNKKIYLIKFDSKPMAKNSKNLKILMENKSLTKEPDPEVKMMLRPDLDPPARPLLYWIRKSATPMKNLRPSEIDFSVHFRFELWGPKFLLLRG